ncbi:MAG: LysR family transcriptional regulator [Candidatus Dormibacteraeota bacterium]|uniref:LysR family transcriptional regulator n=1 Tax=Candidatus Nephthysia bennettiae TaxID=3127016 RepID=A0A934KDG6_9BACT|nr:LysR family transcriptional regulator [Candidatus Dormibacteraeota bacterium]
MTVAEELHFGRAAAILHIAQPPLSQQIKALEAELGVKLFWRSSRRVELTGAGVAFLDGARRTLAEAGEAARSARAAAGGERATIVVGFVDSSVYSFLPDILRAFMASHPTVRVKTRALTSAQQIDALERGDIQVGILRPARASSRIVVQELGREALVVALTRGHPLTGLDRVQIKDLQGEPLVFFQRELVPSVYDLIMGMFHRAGQMPHIVQEAGEQHTLIALVAAGIGYSITAEGLQDWGTRDVVYRPLAHPAAWVAMNIASKRSSHSEPVASFIDSAMATVAARR